MRIYRIQTWRRTPWLAVPLLVALLTNALIPMGFMPKAGGIAMCHGYAPVPVAAHVGAPPSEHNGDHSSQHGNSGMCPYASAASALGFVCTAVALLFALVVLTEIALPAAQIVHSRNIQTARLPRGPPASV